MAGDEFSYGDIPVGIMIYRYMQLIPERPATPNLDRWYAVGAFRIAGRSADFKESDRAVIVPHWLPLHAGSRSTSASPRNSFGTSPVSPPPRG